MLSPQVITCTVRTTCFRARLGLRFYSGSKLRARNVSRISPPSAGAAGSIASAILILQRHREPFFGRQRFETTRIFRFNTL